MQNRPKTSSQLRDQLGSRHLIIHLGILFFSENAAELASNLLGRDECSEAVKITAYLLFNIANAAYALYTAKQDNKLIADVKGLENTVALMSHGTFKTTSAPHQADNHDKHSAEQQGKGRIALGMSQ